MPEAHHFELEVTYNGVEKDVETRPEEQLTHLLQKAVSRFGIPRPLHALELTRLDGSVVATAQSTGTVASAHLTPGEHLVLREITPSGGSG